jgi:hypothetical protein
MPRWSFHMRNACGIDVSGELLLPEGAEGVCRIKVLTVAGRPQAMGFVPGVAWEPFRNGGQLEGWFRRRGWMLHSLEEGTDNVSSSPGRGHSPRSASKVRGHIRR